MKAQSSKQKGRSLQKLVAEKIRKAFNLSERDCKSTPMGVSGPDVQLSDKAAEKFPHEIECKNVERLNLWSSWDQAVVNSGELIPVLVVKKNRREPLAVIDLDYFIELTKRKT